MRINYENITLKTILNLIEIFPDYKFICDGDEKVIILKEKSKDEKNR